MTRPVVVVGHNARLLSALDRAGRHRVVVVEEPDLVASKGGAAALADARCVVDVIECPYQQSDALLELRIARPAAVVPGQEYAVTAAAALADRWRLPGAGPAAALLRDKLLLREATGRAGMSAPAWREVHSASDVATFIRRHGAAVLKPANRQASVGVHLLCPGDDVPAAWRACTDAEEPAALAHRPMCRRYMVEERLRGDEVSVEALVRAGTVLFLNATGKHVLPGARPVERGHDVPAPLPEQAPAALADSTRQLVRATGFQTGMLHAEFKLRRGRHGHAIPTLIECAGRSPGDRILTLIQHAYGFDPYVALVDLLAGSPVRLPGGPARAAAIRFLAGPTGRLARLDGLRAARELPGVLAAAALAEAGRCVPEVTSSWDRLAFAIAGGEDPLEAALRAERALATLRATMEPL
jgi:biotin carboxylase